MSDTAQEKDVPGTIDDERRPFEAPEEKTYQPRSLTRLIWHRFTRHKLGVTGGIIVLLLILIFALSEFFSPYDYRQSHYDYPYVPPMITRLHIDWSSLQVYIYGLRKEPVYTQIGGREYRLPGVWRYTEDRSKRYPLQLFTHGDEYKLLSFIPTDIHLFGTGEPPNSPGQFFPFGTDGQGYDLLSNILFAGRVTLGLAPLVILVGYLVGTLMGGVSGYWGGWVDTLIQRVTEIFMSFPRLALLLVLMEILTIMGRVPPMIRFWSIVGLLSLVTWAPLARVIRGQFLALREYEYTQAAQAVGATNFRIIFRHVMPNIMSYLVVAATLAIPDIIILESILSFLGYGIQHPLTSWGMLLHSLVGKGFDFEMQFHPWLLIPAGFIVITVLAFNFLGDALRDAVDPYTVTEVKEEFG